MVESGYQEPLFVKNAQYVTEALQENIPALLRENHGVGIIGGYYEKGLPIEMISELAIKMLGYGSAEEFESATGNSMSELLFQNKFSSQQLPLLRTVWKPICARKTVPFG